jgi:hypothetical protein
MTIARPGWRTWSTLLCLVNAGMAQTTWTQLAPPAPPPPRHIHGLAQDPVLGLVMFGGGIAGGATFGDTWVYAGNTWSQRAPGSAPSPRSGHGMVLDVWRNRVVLFGGAVGGTAANNETWEWDGASWSQRTPATAPTVRLQFPMTFDLGRGRTVLFSGSGVPADTWEWDGTSWSQVPVTTAPAARCCAAMAYDAIRGVTVLFGGYAGSSMLSDTWEYNGNNWSRRNPATVPPARCCNMMAYDLLRGRAVMCAGANGVSTGEYGDSWEWDGNDWTNRTTQPAPSSRRAFAMVYDWTLQRTLLFGGATYASTRVYYNDIWVYQTRTVASIGSSGLGCSGTAGIPFLQCNTLPWLGDPVTSLVSQVPASSPVLLALSTSNTSWGTLPLPYALDPIGMPGCSLLVGGGAVVTATAVASVAAFAIVIPANPALAGMSVHEQAFVIDPPANSAGATATNALELRLGMR